VTIGIVVDLNSRAIRAETVSEVEDPPLRLLLGTNGYELARAADRDRMASDERWRDLTVSTDHDGAEAQIEELKRMLGVGTSG
jgi:hypothetical protein